ncbi:MAG: subtype B tannase [Bhargavaea sp.]
MTLTFNDSNYVTKTVTRDGYTLTYRAYERISYCTHPKDPDMQRLSIFVNEDMAEGQAVGGYTLENAPIFLPNTVGGYMPGPIEEPGEDPMCHETNASFFALLRGYVVVSPGVRGRGMKNANGENIGTAPAHIVDLKAAVRYLKANRGRIPGNPDRIISNGTSAGGALSALLGSSGNHPDFAPYLAEIGAAEADDTIFAASCYCPITNLDHADMAYEWEFHSLSEYHTVRPEKPDTAKSMPRFVPIDGMLTPLQESLSLALSREFPSYLNSLGLTDADEYALTLDENGRGSFLEFVKRNLIRSAQKELDRLAAGNKDKYVGKKYDQIRHMTENTKPSPAECPAITIRNGRVTDLDWNAFIHFRTRMKPAPAFDSTESNTPENELFGSATSQFRHFTEFSSEHDTTGRPALCAPKEVVKLMNPMNYIGDPKATKAAHFRIRHGAVDRDTSLAISEMLFLDLKDNGIDADIAHPWGVNHAGDYDLEELFDWIDSLCKNEPNR